MSSIDDFNENILAKYYLLWWPRLYFSFIKPASTFARGQMRRRALDILGAGIVRAHRPIRCSQVAHHDGGRYALAPGEAAARRFSQYRYSALVLSFRLRCSISPEYALVLLSSASWCIAQGIDALHRRRVTPIEIATPTRQATPISMVLWWCWLDIDNLK